MLIIGQCYSIFSILLQVHSSVSLSDTHADNLFICRTSHKQMLLIFLGVELDTVRDFTAGEARDAFT